MELRSGKAASPGRRSACGAAVSAAEPPVREPRSSDDRASAIESAWAPRVLATEASVDELKAALADAYKTIGGVMEQMKVLQHKLKTAEQAFAGHQSSCLNPRWRSCRPHLQLSPMRCGLSATLGRLSSLLCQLPPLVVGRVVVL